MAGHRPRSKRCIWPSRRPWRPATPSTNPASLAEQRATWLDEAAAGARRPRRRRGDGADGAARRRAETASDRRRRAGSHRRLTGSWRRWRTPVDLADVARPRRSPTPGPHRRRARRAGRARWWTCSSMRCSIAGRCPRPPRTTASRNRSALRRVDGVVGLHRRRRRPLHLAADPRRRAAPRRRRRPPRRDSRRPQRRWIWRCWRWPRTAPPWMPGRPHWSGRCAPPGARLQLAIAPAGAGKTTAMRALTLAWTEDGGQVIGLAPSAAAAAVLPSRPASPPTPSPNSPGPRPRRPAGLGGRGRAVDLGDHRRGRHGRHPLPRHRRPVRHRPRRAVSG